MTTNFGQQPSTMSLFSLLRCAPYIEDLSIEVILDTPLGLLCHNFNTFLSWYFWSFCRLKIFHFRIETILMKLKKMTL